MLGLHYVLIVSTTGPAVSAEMPYCFESIKSNYFISYSHSIVITYDSFLYSNIIPRVYPIGLRFSGGVLVM